MIRIDKYLADMGAGTRSELKKAIRQGLVSVDGTVVKKADVKVEPSKNRVTYAGKEIVYASLEYYMLHKPTGVVSATEDKKETTVLSLLPDGARRDLFPVGRLDKDTEGLLLLTNDGALAHNLLSPKKHVDKVYYAKVSGVVTEEDRELFLKGVDIGEEKPALPAVLDILLAGEVSEIRITIREGRFHQVKRMFQAVGKEVLYLKRLSMGTLVLDPLLPKGACRPLTKEELGCLKGLTHTKNKAAGRLEELLSGIQAVLFDMDGTLMDSMGVWVDVDKAYMQAYNLTPPADFYKRMEGMSYTETARYYLDVFPAIQKSEEELKKEWASMTLKRYETEVVLKPGLRLFLEELQRRGILTGLATSNDRELAKKALRAKGIDGFFKTICTSCEAGAGKPAPDVYLNAAASLGVPPASCLVFEDVPMGILAGKRAGMRVCAVEDSFSAHQREEKQALADDYIESYEELCSYDEE